MKVWKLAASGSVSCRKTAITRSALCSASEFMPIWYLFVPTPGWRHFCKSLVLNGGDDGTRTRGLCRDRQRDVTD